MSEFKSLLDSYNQRANLKKTHHLLKLYRVKLFTCEQMNDFELILQEVMRKNYPSPYFDEDMILNFKSHIEKCREVYKTLFEEKVIEVQKRLEDELIKFMSFLATKLTNDEVLLIGLTFNKEIERYSLPFASYPSRNEFEVNQFQINIFKNISKII